MNTLKLLAPFMAVTFSQLAFAGGIETAGGIPSLLSLFGIFSIVVMVASNVMFSRRKSRIYVNFAFALAGSAFSAALAAALPLISEVATLGVTLFTVAFISGAVSVTSATVAVGALLIIAHNYDNVGANKEWIWALTISYRIFYVAMPLSLVATYLA